VLGRVSGFVSSGGTERVSVIVIPMK